MSLSLLWGLVIPFNFVGDLDPLEEKVSYWVEQNIGRLGRDVVIF